MDNVKNLCLSIIDGIKDSIINIYVIFIIDKAINEKIEAKERQRSMQQTSSTSTNNISSATKKSNKEKKEKKSNVAFRVLQCCLLNGGLFLLSIIFFNHLLLPMLELLITSFTNATIWNIIQLTLNWIFSCIWIVPLFILSKIFNFFWWQDIADASYEFRRGTPTLIPSISLLLADVVFSLIVQSLFICQGMFLSYVPYIGKFLCFVHICLLYSLYSFEYKWFNQGYELHRRLKLVEYNWPYFLGFGMILAMLTEFTSDSFIIKGCIFSMFFPLLIISSIDSTAKQRINFPIQFFWLVVALPNSFVSRKLKPSNRSSTTPTRR